MATPSTTAAAGRITIVELIAAFWRHAEEYYRTPDGRASSKLSVYRGALRVLRKLYGTTAVADFGPKALKMVQAEMVRMKWRRTSVNKQIVRIKAVFKWGAAQELIPASIFHALQTPSTTAKRSQ